VLITTTRNKGLLKAPVSFLGLLIFVAVDRAGWCA
jgi:hypothetical protein